MTSSTMACSANRMASASLSVLVIIGKNCEPIWELFWASLIHGLSIWCPSIIKTTAQQQWWQSQPVRLVTSLAKSGLFIWMGWAGNAHEKICLQQLLIKLECLLLWVWSNAGLNGVLYHAGAIPDPVKPGTAMWHDNTEHHNHRHIM